VRLPRWPLGRAAIPDPWPALIGGRVLRRARPELVHATQPDLVPLGMAVVASCYDLIPLRFRALYLDGPGRTAERAAYARYLSRLRAARLVLVPTRATAADVVERAGVPEARVRVVPLGVRPAAAPAPAPGGAPPGAHPYVLYSGGLEPHKNTGLLVDALAASRHPDLRLVMTGPWSRRRQERLRGRVAGRRLGERVELRGHVDADALARLRAGALAVLVPSRAEGFGFPALEAMAAGVAVLASDTPALAEVTGGVCPLLPVDDPEAWAGAVDALLDDPAARADLAGRGPAQAARYPWSATAEGCVAAYREALGA
jgi:glycosyltransferase involved in cell wall biosynthesis